MTTGNTPANAPHENSAKPYFENEQILSISVSSPRAIGEQQCVHQIAYQTV